MLQIVFIFGRCHCSEAAVTPAKYECDIQKVNSGFIILKDGKNSATEKIGLVPPTQGYNLLEFFWDQSQTLGLVVQVFGAPSSVLIIFRWVNARKK